MTFSETVTHVIALGEQISKTADAARRRGLESETRAHMASLPAAEVYMLITLLYLGRGDFGTAGLLNRYEQMSNSFSTTNLAIGQILEKPFGQYLSQAISRLQEASIGLDSLLESFSRSPLASVDDGSAIELKIGPWYCDKCGQPVQSSEDGMLQWLTRIVEGKSLGRDLRIVHHLSDSPLGQPNGCYPVELDELEFDGSVLADGHLDSYLGTDGLVTLLSMIEGAELPAADVNRVIMRLFVPGYEQARPYFDKAASTGLVSPNMPRDYFSQEDLKTIVANIHRLRD